jgi:hypothetical protein
VLDHESADGTGHADVGDLGVQERSLDRDILGLEVTVIVDLNVDLVLLVVDGDDVLRKLGTEHEAEDFIGLVGEVLDAIGNAVELDLVLVDIELVGSDGGVDASGQDPVVFLVHLLLALLGDRVVLDEVQALLALLHLALNLDPSGVGTALLAQLHVNVEVRGRVSLEGLLEVKHGHVGELGGGGHASFKSLLAIGKLAAAQEEQHAGLLVNLRVGKGGGGDELNIPGAVELDGEVNHLGRAVRDAGADALKELILAPVADGRLGAGDSLVLLLGKTAVRAVFITAARAAGSAAGVTLLGPISREAAVALLGRLAGIVIRIVI